GTASDITAYAWTVTGPRGFLVTSVSSSLSFMTIVSGTYTATLMVTDASGATGMASPQSISIAHVQPVPVVEEASGTTANASMISLSANVPDPGSDDQFTYTVLLNGNPYIQN